MRFIGKSYVWTKVQALGCLTEFEKHLGEEKHSRCHSRWYSRSIHGSIYCVILCYSDLEHTNLTLLECIDLLKEKRSISITLSNIKSIYRNKETCKNVWSGDAVKSIDTFWNQIHISHYHSMHRNKSYQVSLLQWEWLLVRALYLQVHG